MNKSGVLLITISAGLGLLSAMTACSGHKSDEPADYDVLVTVGDSSLTMHDVLVRIPRGLAPDDSAALFTNIVDEWVRELVLADFAEKNVPDMRRIERMVEKYRNNLIVNSYLQTMTERGNPEISESRVRRYFDENRESMTLEEPLIKGAFLKVSESDGSIDRLRSWMADFSDKSIDRIEEAGLKHASTYKYFKDRWQSWSEISQQIPYRFFDADAFVRSSRNFETSYGGSVYLLHISEFVPSGSEMPYEYARFKIQEILTAEDRAQRTEKLISDIYRQQMDAGTLRAGAYDPVSHTMRLMPAE